jgi:hypothetical protein
MTAAAKLQIWRLIGDKQRAASARMWLMATQAADLGLDLGVIRGIVNVRHGMTDHRVSEAGLQWQTNHLREIVFRQFHFAVENQSQVILRIDRRLGLGPMTFQAESVSFCTQQLRMIAPVRIVASRTPLFESGLMQNLFAVEFRLIGVASQTDVDGIRLKKARRRAGMRTVAVGAVSHGSRMLERGGLNLLRLVRVASHANFFDFSFDENHLAVLRRSVAGLTLLLRKRIVRELLQQLGSIGLVRIVAFKAVGFAERLPVVRFNERFVFHIVTVETEGGGSLG